MLLGLHPQTLHHPPPELEGSAQGRCVPVLYQRAELGNLSLRLRRSQYSWETESRQLCTIPYGCRCAETDLVASTTSVVAARL